MPITFIDIERKKKWRITVLFLILLLMYFVVSVSLFQGFSFLASVFTMSEFQWFGSHPWNLPIIVISSLVVAVIHFWVSASGAVSFVVRQLNAAPPDPEDGIHRRLMNIMDEIHVVTGHKRELQCMVIPSLSLNALAVTDLRGQAVIAVTEGLVSRLSRQQLEAVIAHETYHILSGDCAETTIATSLFGMYASAIEKVESMSDENFIGIHPAFLLFWLLLKLSTLLSLFISREREYRADAASLRMTRNPLAMAESLYIISRNWRGTGIISQGLEMLCIVSPTLTVYGESQGWWSTLLSTHPPTNRRISILLRMARVSFSDLEQRLRAENTPSHDRDPSPERVYYALDPKGQWQGPFGSAEIAFLPWLSPLTWIAQGSRQRVFRASADTDVMSALRKRSLQVAIRLSKFLCPTCSHPLERASYEKTQVHKCAFCGGVLVENTKIPRIIARTEMPCSERIRALARAVINDNQRAIAIRKLRKRELVRRPVILCSGCGNPMHRRFYSLAYLIEIDRCSVCRTTWFDVDELEMLQCIIENRIMPNIAFGVEDD
jgi:heat shock protein HtpX